MKLGECTAAAVRRGTRDPSLAGPHRVSTGPEATGISAAHRLGTHSALSAWKAGIRPRRRGADPGLLAMTHRGHKATGPRVRFTIHARDSLLEILVLAVSGADMPARCAKIGRRGTGSRIVPAAGSDPLGIELFAALPGSHAARDIGKAQKVGKALALPVRAADGLGLAHKTLHELKARQLLGQIFGRGFVTRAGLGRSLTRSDAQGPAKENEPRHLARHRGSLQNAGAEDQSFRESARAQRLCPLPSALRAPQADYCAGSGSGSGSAGVGLSR